MYHPGHTHKGIFYRQGMYGGMGLGLEMSNHMWGWPLNWLSNYTHKHINEFIEKIHDIHGLVGDMGNVIYRSPKHVMFKILFF